MADDKTILLKVELDVTELQKAQKVAATTVKGLLAEKKALTSAEDKDTIAIAKNAAELRKANKTLKDTTNALAVNERQNQSNTGSLAEMREQLAAAKTGFALLSEEARNSEAGVKTAEDMLKLKNAINEIEQSFGTFTGSVGNYEGANKKLSQTLEDIKNGLIPLAKGVSILDSEMEELRKEGKSNTVEFKELESAQESLSEETKKLAGDMEYLGKDILVEVSGSISKMEDRLYEMALAGDTTSKEFIELQEQTARYKQIVIETDKSIDALAEQGRGLSTALALSETVVAGYQAYTGVTAILGDENEALLETITKLQAAQGVLNSIQIIRQKLQENSIRLQQAQTKAQSLYNFLIGKGTLLQKAQTAAQAAAAVGMKALNAVMNANPVLLLVTGIASLVTALLIFEKSTEKAEEANNALNDSLERENKLLDSQIDKLRKSSSQRIQLAEAAGESESKIHELRIEQITEEEKIRKAQLLKLQQDVKRKSAILRLALKEENEDVIESTRESLKESQDKYDELISQNGDYKFNLELENTKYNAKLKSQLKEESDNRDNATEAIKRQTFAILERAKVNIDSADKISANLDKEFEADKKRLSALAAIGVAEAELFGTREAQIEARIKQIEVERDNELNNYELTEAERVLIKYNAELQIKAIREEGTKNAAEEAAKETQIISDENAKRATIALNSAQQLSSALFQIKQNQIQAELNADKEKFDTQTQLLDDQLAAGLISQADYDAKKSALDSKAAAKEKKLKLEAWKAQRTANLVSAGINVALGVTSALTLPPPLGVIMAGVTAALGAVEIAAIASAPTPKFAKGGVFGGQPHSNGGTKGYFDDGTQLEVEKDEHFVIINKNAHGLMSQLDYINQSTGGVPLMAKGGLMKFEGGGLAVSSASQSGNNAFNQSQQLNTALHSMPPIFVAVEDINTGQGQYAKVVNGSDF